MLKWDEIFLQKINKKKKRKRRSNRKIEQKEIPTIRISNRAELQPRLERNKMGETHRCEEVKIWVTLKISRDVLKQTKKRRKMLSFRLEKNEGKKNLRRRQNLAFQLSSKL